MIKAWSHSREGNYEKCHFRAKLLYVNKLEEPRRPLKEGQTEYANDRGSRIHEAAELFVKGGVELIPELKKFAPEFIKLRELYAAGKVSLEGDWAVDKDWSPVAWMSEDVWLRLKLDAMVTMDPTWAVIIDYKTGKRSGNEIKHAGQVQLYVVAVLMRFPDIERITGELWYIDQNELVSWEYTRESGMKFFKAWNKKGIAITTETEFKPNPNRFSCQWCMFSKYRGGNGVCEVGV